MNPTISSSMKMDSMGVIDAPFMLAEDGYADVLTGSR